MTSTDIVKWRKNEWLWKFWKRNDLYENFEKRGGSREKGGGGNEIHAPCACGWMCLLQGVINVRLPTDITFLWRHIIVRTPDYFEDSTVYSFIFEYMNTTFYYFRLKNVFYLYWDFRVLNHCWAFQSHFDFQNFHLIIRLSWPH